jgi:hypothetical protein
MMMMRASRNEECGAPTKTGASSLDACWPFTVMKNPEENEAIFEVENFIWPFPSTRFNIRNVLVSLINVKMEQRIHNDDLKSLLT